MIDVKMKRLLKHLGFTVIHVGTKFKNRFEVVYKAPFDWEILNNNFDINNEIKNAPYEDSPATTVCHYFSEQDENAFAQCIVDDLEKYIEVLQATVERLKKENVRHDS
jgi:uncharacterized small protein (DUF1192 family)